MNAENTNDFTIIHGSEFGLPSNLKCGPGIRPHDTIHFENRRNNKCDYDDSNEIFVTIRRKPKILGEREKCLLASDELERILKFVSNYRHIILDYYKGYTTAKGFLHALREERNPHKELSDWKKIVFVQYDIPLYASYWAKDFRIEYKSKFGLLHYELHRPYSYPAIYTEEEIIQICKKQWPYFLKAENYIEQKKLLIEQATRKLMKSENQFSDVWDWCRQNVEDDIQQIVRNYLENFCRSLEGQKKCLSNYITQVLENPLT